jgi:hypothetical protein
MKKRSERAFLFLVLTGHLVIVLAASTHAQSVHGSPNIRVPSPPDLDPPVYDNTRDASKTIEKAFETGTELTRTVPAFTMSAIGQAAAKQFEKAWQRSGCGATSLEGLVLILREQDGTYRAVSQPSTNEHRQVTFTLTSDVIAIVHTHPNDRDPQPGDEDRRLADKYQIPVYTITLYGMFMYDPKIKKTSRLQAGLDWLNPKKWD